MPLEPPGLCLGALVISSEAAPPTDNRAGSASLGQCLIARTLRDEQARGQRDGGKCGEYGLHNDSHWPFTAKFAKSAKIAKSSTDYL